MLILIFILGVIVGICVTRVILRIRTIGNIIITNPNKNEMPDLLLEVNDNPTQFTKYPYVRLRVIHTSSYEKII